MFPGERSLCERCGYPLRGLGGDAACPECGLPVQRSNPARRAGLPWQRRMDPAAFLATGWAVVTRPGAAYGQMIVGGRQVRHGVYLLVWAVLTGVAWGLAWRQWAVGGVAASLVVTLTTVEAAGVAWVGRRQRWRLRMAGAFRVASYAAPGWVWGSAVWAGALWVRRQAWFNTWDWPTAPGPWRHSAAFLSWSLVAAASVMAFELLVWSGARKVRWAG